MIFTPPKNNDINIIIRMEVITMYLYQRREKERRIEEKFRQQMKPIPEPKNDKRYVALMSSMSHTYGNALAYMQNWIMNLFPEDLFNTIHVNSKIAHRQIRSTPEEFLKKVKPIIIFRPRIPTHNSEDKFLRGTPLIERQTDLYSTWGATNLQPFFQSEEHDLRISYQMNRIVMYVDVICVFSTLMQQLDYYHYIENSVRINHPFTLNTCFESYLSQEMLKIIGDVCGIPIYDENKNCKEFLEFMNQNSIYPITYKLAGETRTDEFYRYYPVSIDTIITDLDKDDGDRTGNVMTSYNLSFTVRMEFNSNGFYYVFSDKIHHLNIPKLDPQDTSLIPIFTDVFKEEDVIHRPGWHMYRQYTCMIEKPNEIINLLSKFDVSVQETIRYHNEHGMPMVEFIDIKLRRQGKDIHEWEDYVIDWNTVDVKFLDQNTYFTYHIIVSINLEYINKFIAQIYNLQ